MHVIDFTAICNCDQSLKSLLHQMLTGLIMFVFIAMRYNLCTMWYTKASNSNLNYCVMICRAYAESVEKKLKSHGLVVECAHLPETVPLLDELEDASKRGVLFGIIISSQHEVHRSVTVHILHGTQQGKFYSHVICTWADSHVITIYMNGTQNGYSECED